MGAITWFRWLCSRTLEVLRVVRFHRATSCAMWQLRQLIMCVRSLYICCITFDDPAQLLLFFQKQSSLLQDSCVKKTILLLVFPLKLRSFGWHQHCLCALLRFACMCHESDI